MLSVYAIIVAYLIEWRQEDEVRKSAVVQPLARPDDCDGRASKYDA